MKKSIIYSLLIILAAFYACDPIEDRDSNSMPITADELEVTATPLQVNGVNSNKVILENHSPVLSEWNYGIGVSHKAADTVLLVVTGTTNIQFTGLNPDGSYLTKEIPVNVDELTFEVAPEWGYLCGSGERTWVWDDTDGQAVWGNGGYLGCTSPCWWTVPKVDMDGQDPDFGGDGKMVFSLNGASITKSNASGSNQQVGTFSFDMSKTTGDGNGGIWAKGKLNTKNVTVLAGFQPNGGNAPVYEYDILQLDNDKMYLSWPEPGAGSWGTAWFWMFKKQ
ncbi:hypothetical protein [uncultured Draconibacterium sp.]|uniref:hypothetical protein n=1 Tax=uncultured Draconibacterium sp. TaxID=1573823 RepID=UPI002AA5E89E|nr:hypothetical protein [uncultured Draconibacterium sp.]